MSTTDPLRIHLSLVSHTNIGKTTLARTLLMRDVGDVADRAHVTETTDDYVLARGPAGCELVLWDTPGFGNSVALAKRLSERSNPVGWFLSEVWDRFTNKAFWLDQRAVRHIRDASSVVLYLVNAAERPSVTPYIPAEMQILSWIGKPVIVLLNQMGKPRPPEDERAELELWKSELASYDFVKSVLPMDAFARCWVQEAALFDALAEALPAESQTTFDTLRTVWIRGRRAVYSSSLDAIALHVWRQITARETVPTPTLKDHMLTMVKHFGLMKKEEDRLSDAQTALSAQAADSFCALTNALIELNGLRGSGISKEILRRMKTDWELAAYSIDPGSAAAVGTGIGATSGAAVGAATDFATGGLSLGLGTLIGGLIGAIGGIGAATLYNARHDKSGIEISWSEHALKGFILEAVLLYLAVAHFGRGRGDWAEGESPEFWKKAATDALNAQPMDLPDLKHMAAEEGLPLLTQRIDSVLRSVFTILYNRSV